MWLYISFTGSGEFGQSDQRKVRASGNPPFEPKPPFAAFPRPSILGQIISYFFQSTQAHIDVDTVHQNQQISREYG